MSETLAASLDKMVRLCGLEAAMCLPIRNVDHRSAYFRIGEMMHIQCRRLIAIHNPFSVTPWNFEVVSSDSNVVPSITMRISICT